MAQLMVSGNNYIRAYAEALIIGTPADQLLHGSKSKKDHGISEEDIARMQKEMETLERDYRLHQDNFGENSLHLNAAQRHVKRLLENPQGKTVYWQPLPGDSRRTSGTDRTRYPVACIPLSVQRAGTHTPQRPKPPAPEANMGTMPEGMVKYCSF